MVKRVYAVFIDDDVKVLPCPGNVPHLNSVEHAYHYVKGRVKFRHGQVLASVPFLPLQFLATLLW